MNIKSMDRFNGIITAVLIVVLSGLLAWLSVRYAWQSDLTRGGLHELSQASQQVLDQMQGEIRVTSYARDDPELRELVRDFLDRYQRYKADIDLKFVNPDTVPDETRNLGIRVNGELIINYHDRVEHVRTDSEQEFTNALQRLLRGTDIWLAIVEGHGERNVLGKSDHDISIWARQMQDRGLNLQPVNLAALNTIPDNTAVLVIASPTSSYLPGEATKILNYLKAGGNLFWLVDPGEQDGLNKLREFLGLQYQAGTIIDIAGRVIGINDPTITLATRQLYTSQPAVNNFDLMTLFPMATPINIKPTDPWQAAPVITTATHTWLERGELKGEISYDKEQDKMGPFNLAVSLERTLQHAGGKRRQRITVIGDSDFISNAYINNSGNLELGLRLIDWLTQDDNLIDIPARTVEDADLQISRLESIIIGFGLLLFLPLCLLLTGGYIWWWRRHL